MATITTAAGALGPAGRAEESIKVVVRIRPLSQKEEEGGRRV